MMRAALLLSFLANIALALLSLAILPERVAIHFGQDGVPNGWASSRTSTLFMFGFSVSIFFALYCSPKLISVLPRRWISLPNRDYWLAPERLVQTGQRFRHYLWLFGTALFLFMFVAGTLTIQANLSEPVRLNERVFLVAFVSFLTFTIYWTVALLRAFRIPR